MSRKHNVRKKKKKSQRESRPPGLPPLLRMPKYMLRTPSKRTPRRGRLSRCVLHKRGYAVRDKRACSYTLERRQKDTVTVQPMTASERLRAVHQRVLARVYGLQV